MNARPPRRPPADLSTDPRLLEGLRAAAALVDELLEAAALPALVDGIAPLIKARLDLDLKPSRLKAALTDGPGLQALEPFAGEWQGTWGEGTVFHRWGSAVTLPCVLEAGGFRLQRAQYAWVGDGFGYNVEVSRADFPRALLGAVFHLEPPPRDDVAYVTPHLGLAVATGQIVWVTPEHLFLECVDRPKGRYSITQLGWTLPSAGPVRTTWIYATTYRRP